MKRCSKTILTCLLALSAAGCMTVGEDDLPDVDSDPDLEETQVQCLSPGCEEQGRRLLSAVLDVDGYLSFPFSGQTPQGDVPLQIGVTGALEVQGGLPLPAELTVTASNGATVGVKLVNTPMGEPGPQYALSYTLGAFNTNPCAEGTAIVIAGDFDDTAHREEKTILGAPGVARRFSFACRKEGVAFKCVDWDYPADRTPGSDAWNAFQTCTRMARNDVCRNGGTFTLDETYVQIFDDFAGIGFDEPPWPFQGLNQWPPPVGVFKFEAVWPDDDKKPPFCLSKTRWQALAPGALDGCEIKPADPRQDATAQFCDDVTDPDDEPRFPSHSLVVKSRYTDILLEEWVNGDDQAVSVSGYYPGTGSHLGTKRPYGNAAGFAHVQTLGTLLRSLPGSIDDTDVIRVYTYSDGSDHVMAADGPGALIPSLPGPTTKTWEGMVFAMEPDFPPTVPLYVYQDPVTLEYSNGTDPNGPNAVLLGYILVPAE